MRCVTFIACLLGVTACRSDEKPKPPPPPPTDGIVLEKPGAAPQRALRYKLASGTVSALDLAMDVDVKTQDLDLKLPTISLAVDLATTLVEPDGTARMKLTVDHARAVSRGPDDEAALKVMDRQAKQLAGLAVTFALTPTGQVKDSKLEAAGRDLSGPMQEQVTTLLQASEQLAMALPEQPVGVGAVWKHRRTMKQNQLTLVTTTTVEVTAIDGDAVTFKSTTEVTGADQAITQGSATAHVTSVGGSGSQTGSFDLAKAVATGEATASLGFEMTADGAKRPTKLVVTTRIAPRAPAPVEPPP